MGMTRPQRLSCNTSALSRSEVFVITALALLLTCSQLFATEEPESTDNAQRADLTFWVNVREVGIIFSAVGRRDRSVPSVTPDDVTVLDQGVPAQVTSVRVSELPIRLGFLIDASASVDKKLETEISMATEFTAQFLHGADSASLMTFASAPAPMIEAASSADVQSSLRAVDAAGLTAVYDSVIKGCSALSAPGIARKTIILLSDGDDTNSYHTQNQVFDVAERSGAVVYTIFIHTKTAGPEDERWMKRLAAVTGGRSFEASGPKALQTALAEIGRDIRSGYVLTFRPPSQVADGNFHQVSVVPRQRDISIRAQAGYVAK